MRISKIFRFVFSSEYKPFRELISELDRKDLHRLLRQLQNTGGLQELPTQGVEQEIMDLCEECRSACERIETVSRESAADTRHALKQIQQGIGQLNGPEMVPAEVTERLAELQRGLQLLQGLCQKAAPEPLAASSITESDVRKIAAAIFEEWNISALHRSDTLMNEKLDRIAEATLVRTSDSALRQAVEQLQRANGTLLAENDSLRKENVSLREKIQEKSKAFQTQIERLQAQIAALKRTPVAPVQPKTVVPVRSNNPYALPRKEYCFDSAEAAARRFSRTKPLDDFFAGVDTNNSYYKIYQSYLKKLAKLLEVAAEGELEDLLGRILTLIYDTLLKKLMVPIYRGRKSGEAEFENGLLPALNKYLSSAGFYTRTDMRVGSLMAEKDYEDMDMIYDSQNQGLPKGTITEIELYPYYIDYMDENGKKRQLHTSGRMMVIN